MNESPFEFRGPEGGVRRGMLCEPVGEVGQLATGAPVFVLLPSGFKHRVGSHRVNVKLARHLASLGFRSLRLDPAGFGESDGSLSVYPVGTLSARLDDGEFASEALMAAAALRRHFGVAQVVMGGLCGGGLTAMLAASRDDTGSVAGVFSIGLPVLPLAKEDAPRAPHPDVARRRMRNYLRKLTSPDAWLRVVRGQSNLKQIRRNLRSAVRRGAPSQVGEHAQNPLVLSAFERLKSRGVPQLMVLGGSDNRWYEFERTFLLDPLKGLWAAEGYQVCVIADGSHELDFAPAQVEALRFIGDWARRFSAEGVTVEA